MKICKNCQVEKPLTEFYIRYAKNSIPSSYCKVCTSIQTLIRQRKLKEQATTYKGGSCSNCGYSKCLAALEFHHLDITMKEFSLSSRKASSFASIKEELDKCILLCANCHREAHWSGDFVGQWNVFRSLRKSVEKTGRVISTKIDWPSSEEMKQLVWSIPTVQVALKLGVSDKSVEKRCKKFGIDKPPRGYWEKLYHSEK